MVIECVSVMMNYDFTLSDIVMEVNGVLFLYA